MIKKSRQYFATNTDLQEKINQYPTYTKIPNMKKVKPFQHEKIWYVTEKIHGSNFSFHYDVKADLIQYGKRKSLISEKDAFFQYRLLLPDLTVKIKRLNSLVLEKYPTTSMIIVYGELFGGSYPHKSIQVNKRVQAIQKGVYYSPDIHFYAFDILIANEEGDHFLDYCEALEIFQQSELMYAEPLATYSTFEEAIQYPIGFTTFLPKKFGLPPLENNKAEGIVVRSSTGRCLVKVKIPEFSESKFSENNFKQEKKTLIENNPLMILEMKKQEALQELTSQRLDNAISKIGFLEDHKEEIFDELIRDILSEIDGYHVNGLYDWLNQQVHETFG